MVKTTDHTKYSYYCHHIDVDAFEEAIGFDPERQGQNKHGEPEDIGQCPDPWSLHKNGDTTGKFAINRTKHLWNCFVCGGGSLLDLTIALQDMDDQEAETWLYQFAKPRDESDDEFLAEIEEILHQEMIAKPVMPYYNDHVLDKWTEDLAPLGGWLKDRGISEEIACKARIGFDRAARRQAPLKPGKPAQEPYSGPCVYLPHFWGGRLVGWQQRWLSDARPKWIPKYTNTSSFPRTETIYNYENVYLAERPVIVCESVPSALFLASLGYPAVATFGGSVSTEQLRLLRRFQQGLVLAPDNDEPGYKWLGYTDDEIRYNKLDRVIMADYLSRFVPLQVIEPVGEYNSGNDLADLLDEGLPFAARAVKLLYAEAPNY